MVDQDVREEIRREVAIQIELVLESIRNCLSEEKEFHPVHPDRYIPNLGGF